MDGENAEEEEGTVCLVGVEAESRRLEDGECFRRSSVIAVVGRFRLAKTDSSDISIFFSSFH